MAQKRHVLKFPSSASSHFLPLFWFYPTCHVAEKSLITQSRTLSWYDHKAFNTRSVILRKCPQFCGNSELFQIWLVLNVCQNILTILEPCIITVIETSYYQGLPSRKQNGEDLFQSFEWLGFPNQIIEKAFAWSNFLKRSFSKFWRDRGLVGWESIILIHCVIPLWSNVTVIVMFLASTTTLSGGEFTDLSMLLLLSLLLVVLLYVKHFYAYISSPLFSFLRTWSDEHFEFSIDSWKFITIDYSVLFFFLSDKSSFKKHWISWSKNKQKR